MRLIAISLLVAVACSDDGKAPSIAALTFTPTTIPTGQQATINASLEFTDEDGDLARLEGEATLPGGMKAPVADASLSGLAQTSGTLPFALVIAPPQAGAYQIAIWVTDEGGNESNRLTGTITAQ